MGISEWKRIYSLQDRYLVGECVFSYTIQLEMEIIGLFYRCLQSSMNGV